MARPIDGPGEIARAYPARQHLDGAVGARRGDPELEHRRDLEAQEPDAAKPARERERAGPGPRRREALERAGVEEGLHTVGVPQELAYVAAGDAVREPDALPPPRRQPRPPSSRRDLARLGGIALTAVSLGVAASHRDPP